MKKDFLMALSLMLAWFFSATAFALSVNHLRVNSLINPEPVDTETPKFSWQLQSDERGVVQTAYKIVVTSDKDGANVVWDSGFIESDMSVGVPATGIGIQPSQRYYWSVTVRDNKGNEAKSSEVAWFATGLMTSGWSGASWIQASDLKPGESEEEITDYIVEGKVRIERTAAGLCFAMQDAGNFYFWQLNTEGSVPRLRPHVWNGGSPACMANIDLSGKVNLNNTDEFTLRIEVSNARTARTYINDVFVDERTGNFKYGKIGMREDHGETDSREEIGVYDDISVKKSDGTVLFSEDFSEGNSFTAGTVVNEKLRIVGSTTNTVYAWQRAMTNEPVHYTLEGDMILVKAAAAFIFASTASNTYHMWQINCQDNSNPAVRHHTYINGALTWNDSQFTQFKKTDILGHKRHIKIEVEDNKIRTSVDGILVDTFDDQTGTAVKGLVGMRVDNNTGEEAYFDNLVLTEYDADGNGKVTLSEDFENLSSDFFYDAVIEEKDGSRMCHVKSASGEKKVMQSAVEGVPMFRKTFNVTKTVKQAQLYTSGLGVYDVFVNGKRVGHLQADGSTLYEELKPGWTDYRSRVFYSSHDVTALLNSGENAIGALVTSGWWAGAVMHGIYGSPALGFIAKLLITYDDGTQETIVSDLSWKSSKNGALRQGEIYDGEIYDARLNDNWTSPSYNDSQWNGVALNQDFDGSIDAFTGGYVLTMPEKAQKPKTATIYEGSKATGTNYGMINVVSETQNPQSISLKKGQAVIIDFGQNIVGDVNFKVKGNAGNRLRMRFTEMLNDTGDQARGNDGPGGSLYLTNLRSAKAELYYTMDGSKDGEQYQPSTTFFGFRYCEILPSDDVEIVEIEALPMSSSTEDTGSIVTSSADINQLFSNIQWGQRGNLLSIPTDCPQRDERLGWTADTQVFSRTGMYNAATESFYRKWMQDMRDSQRSDGAYPNVAPFNWVGYGDAAWSDAGIIVPWNIYLMYGDLEALKENFASMERYMTWMASQTGEGYQYQGAGTAYGDWLAFAGTDSRYISVAYYAYDAQLMAKMARALSTADNDTYARKADRYERLFNNIKAEFRKRYITPVIRQTTQTAYLMALQFNLLEGDDEIADFKTRLQNAIIANSYKLSTGFLGTAVINTTLSRFDLSDYAYDLLLQRECPSWLYSIDQGATTIWERWNSYTIESGFGDPSMNSFNHYAYGAVGEWMYRYMLGIDTDEETTGFKNIVLHPQPDMRTTLPTGQNLVTSAEGTYNSYYGDIVSSWQLPDGQTLTYRCTVPANTTATLLLPVADEETAVYEGGKPIAEVEGIEVLGYEDGKLTLKLGSGNYEFKTDVTTSIEPTAWTPTASASSVFDIAGRKINVTGKDMPALNKGIYIVDGRKVAIR